MWAMKLMSPPTPSHTHTHDPRHVTGGVASTSWFRQAGRQSGLLGAKLTVSFNGADGQDGECKNNNISCLDRSEVKLAADCNKKTREKNKKQHSPSTGPSDLLDRHDLNFQPTGKLAGMVPLAWERGRRCPVGCLGGHRPVSFCQHRRQALQPIIVRGSRVIVLVFSVATGAVSVVS